MDEKIFEFSDLEIWRRGDRYFVRYDAGSHQVVMREDEISKDEALFAASGKENAIAMLHGLQERLLRRGVDPYVSNLPKPR